MSKEFLREVEEGKEFFCKDGRVIKSLEELAKVIKELHPEVFMHHVNEEKNDFANWIRDVIGDHVLANRLKRVKKQSTMDKIISARIAELSFL